MLDALTSQPQFVDRRYILRNMLGQGGMGIVYHVTDRIVGKDVALKRVISQPEEAHLSTSYGITDFRLSLAREFKLSASLRHPNIVEVLDYGFDAEQMPFYTMQLLNNPQTILNYALQHPINKRIELIMQLLNALTYLHRRGIIHRDLKPANVLVENGQVKVLDFGLSIMSERSRQGNELEEDIAGTLAYIAPELLTGDMPSIASDLYAVGMMGYEMIAGHHPFDILAPSVLINQILMEIPNVSKLDVDESVSNVLYQLLQKDPESRFDSALQVIEILEKSVNISVSVDKVALRESFLQAARLVGRDKELSQLETALSDAIAGISSVWLIGGESGVGKTRLLDELRTLALVNGALVMQGYADRVGNRPYEMWLPILRWFAILMNELTDEDLAFLANFVPDLSSLLGRDTGDFPPLTLKPNDVPVYMVDMIRRLQAHLERPLLIMLEDLHWSGRESLSTFNSIIEQLNTLPSVMLTASYRDDEKPHLAQDFPGVPILRLGRLNKEFIAELSVAMLGEAGKRDQVVDLLEQETEGNVFFLIEVVRALAEEVGQLDQIGLVTLPQRVFAGGMHTVIERRLRQISVTGRILLQLASVMGRTLNLNLLKAIEPTTDIEHWLLECLNASVLQVSEGHWSFAHDKLRQGVLNEVAPDELRLIHTRIATTIEKIYGTNPSYINALLEHWGQAGNITKELAYLNLSGDQDLHIGLYEDAIEKFTRALSLVDKIAKDVAVQQVIYKQKIAEAHLGIGNYATAEQLYQSAYDMAQQQKDDSTMASIMLALGDVANAHDDFTIALEKYQRAFELFEQLGEKSSMVEALNRLGHVVYDMGDEKQANHYYKQSLSLSRSSGEQWSMAGAIQYDENPGDVDLEDFQQAEVLLQETLKIYQESNNRQGIADTLLNLGIAADEAKHYDAAFDYYTQSASLKRDIGDFAGLSSAYQRMGRMATVTQQYTSAATNLRISLRYAQQSKIPELTMNSLMSVARLYIEQDKLVNALEIFAFLAYAPDVPEGLQDEAERHIMAIETRIDSDKVEQAWLHGKSMSLEDALKLVLD